MNKDNFSATTPSKSSILGKKERKRLKKLRNRVQQEQDDVAAERTGLLREADWLEYQNLEDEENLKLVGPSIRLRKRNSQSRGVVPSTECDHHRNIIACLLRQQSTTPPGDKVSKKRSRSERDDTFENPTFPAWATFHNPAAFEKLAVLELHVTDVEAYSKSLQPVLDKKSSSLSLPTRWFQGHHPKSISESLLYFHTSNHQNASSNNPSDEDWSLEDLVKELQTMTITKDIMLKEGYPQFPAKFVGKGIHQMLKEQRESRLQDPSTVSPLEAKTLVESLGFRLDEQPDGDSQRYVTTQDCSNDMDKNADPRVFGLDCEMVQTKLGAELARITIVQLERVEAGSIQTRTVLDAFVKPEREILDYVTSHSGITPQIMTKVSTNLDQVQAALLSFFRPQDILVGHSLENDLKACRLIHTNVIDTAILFRPRNRMCKFSLRHLVKVLLRRTIQDGSHCSEQDAIATLELAVRRALEGDSFGITGSNRKSVFEVVPKECTSVCLGPSTWLRAHVTNQANGVHALGYESIPDCQKAILSYLASRRKSVFIYSRLALDDRKENMSNEVTAFVSELVGKMPPTSLMLICLQQSYRECADLSKRRKACTDPRSSVPWSIAQEDNFQKYLHESREGLVFWVGSKNSSLTTAASSND